MSREDDIRRLVGRLVDQTLASTPAAGDARRQGADDSSQSGNSQSDNSQGGKERIALGADHGGVALKDRLAEALRQQGYDVEDCGTQGGDSVDYPVFAHAVAQQVASGRCRWGIIVDGAGIGSCMVANKVPGVRAALCYDLSSAKNSREHNHANVLTLGAGLIGPGLAQQIVSTWLETPWGGDRHARRVGIIDTIEKQYLR